MFLPYRECTRINAHGFWEGTGVRSKRIEWRRRGEEPASSRSSLSSMQRECALMLVLLACLNFPLFFGAPSTRFIFRADAVAAGEWWRLLTHPWVHIS